MLQRQNQMVQFLSKALQHPEVLSQLVGARQRVSSSSQAATGAHRQLLFASRCHQYAAELVDLPASPRQISVALSMTQG